AHTDVTARWLSTKNFQELCDKHPKIGMAILTEFGRDLTHKIRTMNDRMANYISTEKVPLSVDEMIARAVVARKAFEDWSEKRIDALLKDIAEAIADKAQELAEKSVEETKIGVAAHKVLKIRFASLDVYKMLVNKPGMGILKTDDQLKVTEIASPMGVVLGLIPLTNPVPTLVFKTLICLKSRNALILSCHHNAMGVGSQAGDIIQDMLCRHGAPVDLVQWIKERTSRRTTSLYMMHKDVSFILATGGPSMVKAAYSSGTPAIGVGPGNAPTWICSVADPDKVAEMVVGSKSFDNGVICGSENNLVVDVSIRESFIEALKKHGAAVLEPDEIDRFTEHVVNPETQRLHREVVGQSAQSILAKAGIECNGDIRLIVIPLKRDRIKGPYGYEKLAPVLSLFTADGEVEGMALCKEILANEGTGHTAIIHTNDEKLAELFGLEMPVSRSLVNCPGSQGCIGMVNGLIPSLTLGCGTFGGTSTTDNVSYTHLVNIKRIAQAL
ncbi:MAG: aldehyde dehydrogenase family protein, partial [Planctomycetota bacterium]